mgnify:CR=1 FL=1
MTKRESRVIGAFLLCVAHGEYSAEYATILIEDNQRYGWLSEAAKEAFYAGLPGGEDEAETPDGAEDVPEEAGSSADSEAEAADQPGNEETAEDNGPGDSE